MGQVRVPFSPTVWEGISAAAVAVLWGWTLYYLLIVAIGWPRSKRAIREPFRPEALRNPVDLPSLTVIVAARDEENVIHATLERILRLHYPKDLLQLVVAEDGSRDRTREICEAFAHEHPEVRIVHDESSTSKAAALNRALRDAEGDIAVFLDADSKFDSDLLLRAAKFFHDHPDVNVAQAIIETYADRWTLVAKLDDYESTAWFHGVLAGKDRLGLFVPLAGTGMFIRRSALERVGGWNTRCLAEDVEMAARLTAAGEHVSVLPAQVWRQPPYTIRDFIRQRQRWWGGSLQVLPQALRFLRNRDVPRRRRADMVGHALAPLVFVGGTVYLVLSLLLSPIQASRLDAVSSTLFGIATSQIVLLGAVIGHCVSRRSARDLDLIPGVYLYWALQLYAVLSVVIALVVRRPPRWRVTAKRRIPTVWPSGEPVGPSPTRGSGNGAAPDGPGSPLETAAPGGARAKPGP